MKDFLVYDLASGELVSSFSVRDEDVTKQYDSSTHGHIEDDRNKLETHFFLNGALVEKYDQATVYDPAGPRLSGLPVPCVIRINCTEYPCEDAVADIEFDQYGEYYIRVTSARYKPWEATVEYQAP